MDTLSIINGLRKEFPGKAIVAVPEQSPEEIVCEIAPASEHADYSTAIVVYCGASAKHFHRNTKETYFVEKGTLTVYIGDTKHVLSEGESIDIPLDIIHWAEGNNTRIRVESKPGWTFADHIVVSNS